MLSLAYLLIVNDTYDKTFINKYTVGFEEFKKYVLGKKKNKPCTPKWASSITGIPEEKINVHEKVHENKVVQIGEGDKRFIRILKYCSVIGCSLIALSLIGL